MIKPITIKLDQEMGSELIKVTIIIKHYNGESHATKQIKYKENKEFESVSKYIKETLNEYKKEGEFEA